MYGIFDMVVRMATRTAWYSKTQWKTIIVNRIWAVEEEDWLYRNLYFSETSRFSKSVGSPKYISWWFLADIKPHLIAISETMVKLLCKASLLLSDNLMNVNNTIMERACRACDHMCEENMDHILWQCDSTQELRNYMFSDIEHLEARLGINVQKQIHSTR